MIEGPVNSLTLNAHSYLAGERVVCRLTVVLDVPLDSITNVSLAFFRVEAIRDQFAFSFGTAPRVVEDTLKLEQNFPADFRAGLYGIGGATLSIGSIDGAAQPSRPAIKNVRVAFSPVIFQVRAALEQPASPEAIAQQAAAIFAHRAQLAGKPFIVAPLTGAKDQPSFSIFVFGVGCLIHQPQQLEGFAILPFGRGLSHRDMSDIVNGFLKGSGFEPLPFIEATEQAFAASTPVFAVAYATVVATGPEAALEYCRQHAERVFSILGIDRGQKPRAFAYVANQHNTNQWWHRFAFPGYRGNLLSDFNPMKTANEIERLLPRLEANPFSRLIVSTYSDATSEHEYGFALLRFWSVLELVADRAIAGGMPVRHPDGTTILNARGNPETTNSKHGRVYAYILAHGAFEETGSYAEAGVQKSYHVGDARNPNVTTITEVFTLWEMVRATYAIRNAVAHEGQFDLVKAQAGDMYQQLAARLRTSGQLPDPLRFIKMQAQFALWREV